MAKCIFSGFKFIPQRTAILFWNSRHLNLHNLNVCSLWRILSPSPFSRAAWIGFTNLRRMRLASPLWIIVIPLCIPVIPLWILVIPQHPPLILVHLQEPLSPRLIPRSPGEGGEGGIAAQPMRIQLPAQPPQWPRMSAGPIGIRHPRERPSINQRPVTPPRWWVPQCTKSKASTPLIYHSLPLQQPIEIQHSSLAWTTVDFQGFISPDRIGLPLLLEWTTRDLASPHLLCWNPAPNPSLDCLLGNKWLVLHERLGKL